MFPPVFRTLHDNTAVEALVGDRIYRHGDAPQGVASPYVTWFLVNVLPENHLSGTPPVDAVTVQMDCWHTTDKGVEELAVACRDAIEPLAHVTSIPLDNRDIEATKLYRVALQFDWWLSRSA